jgi:hypothetical protein
MFLGIEYLRPLACYRALIIRESNDELSRKGW